MDLRFAIDRNRQDLLRIVAMLFAAAGLVTGGSAALLPRQVRNRVFRQLRSAEAALRRLLVVAALSMVVELSARRSDTTGASKTRRRKTGTRKTSSPLIESLPDTGERQRRSAPGAGPRIRFFDGSDPEREAPADVPLPNDDVDASGLCGRLHAFQDVLENLSKHARRVALWQARREAEAQAMRDAAAAQLIRRRPVRLGRPAGYRARGRHPVDAVLSECHLLMLYALRSPDTG